MKNTTMSHEIFMAIRNDPDMHAFREKVFSEFKCRRVHVQAAIIKEAEDLYEYHDSIFGTFHEKPNDCVQTAIKNAQEWLKQDRREITAEELMTYSRSYLFFTSLERRTK